MKHKWKKRVPYEDLLYAGEAWLLWLRSKRAKQIGGGLDAIVASIVDSILMGHLPMELDHKGKLLARRRARFNLRGA